MLSNLTWCWLLAIAALCIVQRLAREWRRRQYAKRLGCLPANRYPHTDPFGFDLHRARVDALQKGRRNAFDHDLFIKYGSTYEERANLTTIVNTTETANFQAVATTQFFDFGRGRARLNTQNFFGRGLLSLNGAEWKPVRELVTPLFKRSELSDIGCFKTYVDRLLALLPRDGKTVDMQTLLQKLFLDSATEFIFGETIDSLRDPTTKSQDFLQAFNEALAGNGKRSHMGGAFSFIYMFDKEYELARSKVYAFIDDKIKKYYRSSQTDGDTKQPSRQRYTLIEGMAKEIKNPVELRYHLLNILFPARDTTAIAVSNTLFCLARHPRVWGELRKEALRVQDQPMTFELLKGLHLFRYTLFEAIRLYGPSGQIRREAFADTTLPRGGGEDGSAPLFVRKGSLVYLNNFPKTRDPQVWGDDVESFRPERFQGKLLTWEFTPFYGGPRMCPAINQVISQGVYLLVRLAQEFETLENRDECWEYVEATRMMVESRNGIKVAFHPGSK